MLAVRRSGERGHARHGWLESFHTFSFAGYQDPRHMGFRDLRVINEDFVQPAQGFATHSHRDMEILTWVLSGELAHRDSLGNGSVIRPGDVQRMSAGTGVTHSEFNHSDRELVHLLQIWFRPARAGFPPSYEQRHFDSDSRRGQLRLVASRDARDGSVALHQDADVLAGLLGRGESLKHSIRPGRHLWVQVARGSLDANGARLEAGDGAALSAEPLLELSAREPSELLVFDLR
jgi:hypothetical protein